MCAYPDFPNVPPSYIPALLDLYPRSVTYSIYREAPMASSNWALPNYLGVIACFVHTIQWGQRDTIGTMLAEQVIDRSVPPPLVAFHPVMSFILSGLGAFVAF